MQFLWWLTGVMAVIAGCRFILLVFRKLTSKESMEAVLNKAENGLKKTATNATDFLKKKKQERHEFERPKVTIR